MSYRFRVWNSDCIVHNYTATLPCDKFGIASTVALEVSTYKEAIELKRKLKKAYTAGQGWNTNNSNNILKTLCW